MFIPLRDENPTSRFPAVTVALIAVNAAVFLFQAASPQGLELAAVRFGAVPYAITHLRSLPEAAAFPPLLTLLTSMFVHGSLFHLLGNMLYLWIFGNNIEDRLGAVRFGLFYVVCGVIAALTHILFQPGSRIPMIGASGAIAGFTVDVVAIPAGIVLGLWFFLQILNVGMGGGVAWFAHVGGFLAGLLLIRLAGASGRSRVSWRES
jgi:membrane associated rhomboid family serine protease